jgi:hypothetical protein
MTNNEVEENIRRAIQERDGPIRPENLCERGKSLWGQVRRMPNNNFVVDGFYNHVGSCFECMAKANFKVNLIREGEY